MLEAERTAVRKAQKGFVELESVPCGWGPRGERECWYQASFSGQSSQWCELGGRMLTNWE